MHLRDTRNLLFCVQCAGQWPVEQWTRIWPDIKLYKCALSVLNFQGFLKLDGVAPLIANPHPANSINMLSKLVCQNRYLCLPDPGRAGLHEAFWFLSMQYPPHPFLNLVNAITSLSLSKSCLCNNLLILSPFCSVYHRPFTLNSAYEHSVANPHSILWGGL